MVLGLGGPLGAGIVAGDLIVVAVVAHIPLVALGAKAIFAPKTTST